MQKTQCTDQWCPAPATVANYFPWCGEHAPAGTHPMLESGPTP